MVPSFDYLRNLGFVSQATRYPSLVSALFVQLGELAAETIGEIYQNSVEMAQQEYLLSGLASKKWTLI